jgi:hypothetical protein
MGADVLPPGLEKGLENYAVLSVLENKGLYQQILAVI